MGQSLREHDATVVQDAFGLWAIITKPQLPGAAEWTHRLFPTRVSTRSTDTAFTLPSMTQWLDTPYNHGAGARRIAGGRLLCVMEGAYSVGRPERDVDFLHHGRRVQRSRSGNGTWESRTPPTTICRQSC